MGCGAGLIVNNKINSIIHGMEGMEVGRRAGKNKFTPKLELSDNLSK
jgi:hypothetical protein